MCSDHIHPSSPNFLRSTPCSPSTQLFKRKAVKTNLCCPNIVGCMGRHGSMADFPGAVNKGSVFLGRLATTLPAICHLWLCSWGMRFCLTLSSPCWDWSVLGIHRSHACCHNCREFICATALLCPEETFFLWSSTASAPFPSFWPIFAVVASFWRKGCIICVKLHLFSLPIVPWTVFSYL